jgi:uncharacterized protein
MSAAGQDPVDVDVLAADSAGLTRHYALGRFARLAGVLASPEGDALAQFSFMRLAEGLAGCELSVKATVALKCQRCLETFRPTLESTARLAFVGDDVAEATVPEGYEAVAVLRGRVDLAALVEDELLLSLPVVALHGEGTRCAGAGRPAENREREQPAAETHRPFAQLQELMKH